ncbi:MAG: hypothetical protein ACOYN0_07305 [Phycisphaerales bacterium]
MRMPTFAVPLALFLGSAAVAGPPEDVEALLTRMEAAVLNADAFAYMTTVDPENAFFMQEQSEWAKDLKANPVEAFDLIIGGEAPEDATMAGADAAPEWAEDVAHVPLTMVWKLKGEPEQRVKFPAAFHKRDGAWRYSGEHLEELVKDGFVIRYPKGYEATAQQIAEAFPVAKAHVDAGFEITNNRFEHIKLYDSQSVLQASVYPSMYKTDLTLSGWNEKGESIKFATWYTDSVAGWTKAFAHEYGHVGTWELGAQSKGIAWWVAEGAAELAAEDFPPNTRNRVQRWAVRQAAEGTLAAWEDITDYVTTKRELRGHPYHQGHAFIGYISDRFGRKGRNAWLAALCNGKSLDEASTAALGMSFVDLDAAWRASLVPKTPEAAEPGHEQELADIERTISSMERAVLAADIDGYMVNVLKGDAEFEQEQLNFAKDLPRKTPDSFDIQIEAPKFSDGLARAKMTMVWHIPGQEAEGDRKVSFDVKFIRENTRWLYAGEDWLIHDGGEVMVYYPKGGESRAKAAAEAFAAVKASVLEGFELSNTAFAEHRQKIKMYRQMEHLQASIFLAYEDGLGGWNEPGESIKMLASGLGGDMRNVIAHEYGHCATFSLGPKSNDMAWWVLEGAAELAAEPFGGGRKGVTRSIERTAKAGKLRDWPDLADFHTIKQENYGMVYTQGHHMIGYIDDTFGRTKRVGWLRSMSNGATMDEASREVLGRSFADLDTEWRALLPSPEAEKVKDGG